VRLGCVGSTPDLVEEASELAALFVDPRRKKENLEGGAEEVGVCIDCVFSRTGGDSEVGGLSIPMSFIVAAKRSRSRRSSSSSSVSSFLAPGTTTGVPGFKVSGRRFAFCSGFFSPEPPNKLKPFQSKDMDLREAFVVAGVGLEVGIESKVVSLSVGDKSGD